MRRADPALRVVETVRCLECGTVYSRLRGWNSAVNPGCPDCSYVGWQPFSVDTEPLQLRSAADLLHSRPDQPR
jgi:predicted  nucleic acid-binding Zn-ribbon protein